MTTQPNLAMRNWNQRVGRTALYLVLILACVAYLVPLVVMVMTSLKTAGEVQPGTIFMWPENPSFDAWIKAWSQACIGLDCRGIRVGFWNSVMIWVPSLILSILAGAILGFALSRWQTRHAGLILGLVLFGAFIPLQVVIYPLIKMAANLGLYNSFAGIVVVHIIFGLPVLTLIFSNFYVGIPVELINAARVDGAGFFRIFFGILLPMSRNILIVALVLQGTGIWNDYIVGVSFGTPDIYPMTVKLQTLVGSQFGEKEYNVNMAATLLTSLPPLLLYLVSGRYFVRGITSGAVKG
ncbi:carbohydrate ABC transporter permease [Oceaniglobus trochenteri]|uniref:carbohydrate ABC transporter permease n=1 Tax=Oceaniglobus trochenteri TaxID=2763260 RepID=UPI001CFFA5E2|nr:carbohydrate ABC transporter permease [Oceaniglobus trochenteri]